MKARKFITAALITVLLCAALVWMVTSTKIEAEPNTSALVINEVMASNKGSVPDEYGNYPDWVELKNLSSEEVDVGGLGLSDALLDGAKYVIPSGTKIAAGGFLVIYCSGSTENGLYAPFRISSSEAVVLFDSRGQALDSVGLRAVAEGKTLALDGTGNYMEQSPSPGYPNDEAGIAAFAETLRAGEDLGVVINEFMASNITTLGDAGGLYSDWIELYNPTSADVDLSGCGISDSLDQPMKYSFSEGTIIKANGYLLIFCSGNESTENGEIHVPFSLRSYEEDVVLAGKTGKIADSFSYSRQQADVSMARVPDGTGEFTASHKPTPGYPNTDDGYAEFTQKLNASLGDIYISEMMGLNINAYKDAQGEYIDWFELHNAGTAAVNLSGYGVTNDPNNPAKWVFPDVSVEAGGYLTVYASGLPTGDAQKKNQLDLTFSISSTGEALYLFDPQGNFLNKLNAGAFLPDVSCGRDQNGETVYYKTATPGSANSMPSGGITATPVFLTAPGIFDSGISLEISVPAGETVYYTTDCNTPTASAKQYTGPVTVNENTVIRAISVRDGYITGSTVSGTYLFTTDGVNHALPVVTLVTDPTNLWDEKTGIYAYGENFDPDAPTLADMLLTANYYEGRGYQGEEIQSEWERPGNFAVFNDDGVEVFNQNISMRIAGGYGRMRAQKGFTIIARSEYGSNSLAYPFFENRPFTEYKSLVLRAGAQDQTLSKIRDELSSGLLEGTDVNMLYQAYKPYVLYLNGEYWGTYFLREKRSRFFVAQHEGTADNDNMDIVKSETRVSQGTTEDWKDFMAYVNSHDLSDASAYVYVESQMDVNSFMDYMISEIYVANTDTWNIQYYKLPNGKWKWIYYDFCWGWGDYTHGTVAYRRMSNKPCSDLFNQLLKNSTWRDAFLRRFGELMKSVYAPDRVNALVDELYAAVEPEIERERALFNASTFMGKTQVRENLASYDTFKTHIQKIRTFAEKRPDVIKQQLQAAFSLSDSYMSEVFG